MENKLKELDNRIEQLEEKLIEIEENNQGRFQVLLNRQESIFIGMIVFTIVIIVVEYFW